MEMVWQIVIDCANPSALVAFWALALGYVPEPAPAGHSSWREYWLATGVPEVELVGVGSDPESLVDPVGRSPRIWFQAVPEPKTGKNRLHLDLKVGGGPVVPLPERVRRVDQMVERLAAAGGARLRVFDEAASGRYNVLMADPEGNEFCVV